MKVKELINLIEARFPLDYQESYDNSGLLVGDENQEISKVLLSIDVDESVIEEAKQIGANLIISHHPIIFKPLYKLTGTTFQERTVIKAIKSGIALYAAHTSLDAAFDGINKKIAEKLGLKNLRLLDPLKGKLKKLVTFVPTDYAAKVREAIFSAGAGVIGNYDSCSYNLEGTGTFRAGENTNPFVGEKGKLHFEPEIRIETIFPEHLTGKVIAKMLEAHPYEEPAYDIYPLENAYPKYGFGLIGEFEKTVPEEEFLQLLKNALKIKCLKHSPLQSKEIKLVGICSGGCDFMTSKAIAKGLDAFISGEFKYSTYIMAKNQGILIAEAGHFETEILSVEIFYDLITKNFSNFAVEISKFQNPVNCL